MEIMINISLMVCLALQGQGHTNNLCYRVY